MAGISDTLRKDLRDIEFAEVYADTFLDTYVATQIKVLREQRKMTQGQLAKELITTQTAISRIESVNYSAWSIKTLKKVAHALGVRLHVSFETFGSLIGDMERFGRESLQRPSHAEDPILNWPSKPELVLLSTATAGKARMAIMRLDSGGNETRYSVSDTSAPREAKGGL